MMRNFHFDWSSGEYSPHQTRAANSLMENCVVFVDRHWKFGQALKVCPKRKLILSSVYEWMINRSDELLSDWNAELIIGVYYKITKCGWRFYLKHPCWIYFVVSFIKQWRSTENLKNPFGCASSMRWASSMGVQFYQISHDQYYSKFAYIINVAINGHPHVHVISAQKPYFIWGGSQPQ